MFVGYSLADDDFTAAASRVRHIRAHAKNSEADDFATVLALHPDAVRPQPGLTTITMLDPPDTRAAARLLEISRPGRVVGCTRRRTFTRTPSRSELRRPFRR
ncbi:hypothetical protein [Mycobacterium sp. AMU20-3851]|uniref:hypothetical protein n=1 Tax=Mycobacterium sp. AMU20-3851 TaxID=3122055 RepID=UPI003754E9AE